MLKLLSFFILVTSSISAVSSPILFLDSKKIKCRTVDWKPQIYYNFELSKKVNGEHVVTHFETYMISELTKEPFSKIVLLVDSLPEVSGEVIKFVGKDFSAREAQRVALELQRFKVNFSWNLYRGEVTHGGHLAKLECVEMGL